MVEPDEPAAVVDHDADRVEADLGGRGTAGASSWRNARAICRTCRRLRSSSASQIASGRRARRVLTSTNTSARSSAHDEVDLAEAGAVVAGDERVAEALEVLERALLAEAAEDMTGI